MKNIVLVLFVLLNTMSFAQKTELTLQDAVMQQYRSLRPEGMYRFDWIPNTSEYTLLADGYTTVMKASISSDQPTKLTDVAELNEKLGSGLYHLYGMSWKNKDEMLVSDGRNYYVYNVSTGKGAKINSLPKESGATKYHGESGNLAFTIENNVHVNSGEGKSYVVTKNEDPNIVSGQAIARSEFGITEGLFWSKDGSKLAFYQKDESNVSDYPLLDNSVTPGVLKSIKYPMAGTGSEIASVGIFDLKSAKTVYFKALHGEENYLTNLSWTNDGKYVLVAEVNRDQDHMWLNVFDASNGKFVKTLFEETSDKWVEPEHPAFFPNDSYNFVWVSEKDGFNNLYYYDFEGKLIKQLTKHEFVVKDIEDFKNGMIYYSATGESPLETQFYAVSLSGEGRKITTAKGTHHVQLSSDGKYFHDNYSSHDVANQDLIVSTEDSKVVKSNKASVDKLQALQIGTAEIGTLKAKDGTTLYTRLIKPSNFDPNNKYPVLVYVYGGPHAQLITDSWLDGASLWMYWMAEQGYLVYTVDNRGSANRGVAFEKQIHRQLGTLELEDQMSGVEYLKSLPYVDGDRLAVHGWSFGGFMTTSLMLREAGTFNAGVAGGPVTDWSYYEVMYGERYMDRPEQNPEGYKNASLMTHADKLEDELLLIHGTVDPTVVMQHSFSLVQKFVDLGIQIDFFPYPMHEHNVRGKDRVHLMRKVLDFVLENNK